MADIAKLLAQQLATKKIDAFLKDYQLVISQQRSIPADSTAYFQKEYSKWKAVMQSIESLLVNVDASIPSKGWLVHSGSSHAMTAAINRSKGQFEIKYSFKLQSGLQSLCKLMSEPAGYKELLPFCYQSQEIHVDDNLEKDVLIKYKAPFLNERILLLHLLAVDRLDHNNTIVVYAEGASMQKIQQTIEAAKKQKEQLKGDFVKLKNFAAEIKVNPSEYVVTTYASLEDSLSLPEFVLRKLLQLSSSIIVANLIKIIRKQERKGQEQRGSSEHLGRCIEERLRLKYPGRL